MENSHDLDYHLYFSNPVAAWLFWPENQYKLTKNRQLDPYLACNRDNTRRFEPPRSDMNLWRAWFAEPGLYHSP